MNKSVNKALDILELFWLGYDELSLSEMAQLTKLDKATIYRIVSTLTHRKYLKQNRNRGKYALGTSFLDYSGIFKRNIELRDVALPYLAELTQSIRESAIIGVWDGKESVITESFHASAQTESPLKVIPEEGSSLPLHCTGSGKIFIANMTKSAFEDYYRSRTLIAHTPNSITNLEELNHQLNTIRQTNLAYDLEEYALGVKGVASGIRDFSGQIVGSVAIVGPSVRLDQHMIDRAARAVKQSAVKISRELGYRGRSRVLQNSEEANKPNS